MADQGPNYKATIRIATAPIIPRLKPKATPALRPAPLVLPLPLPVPLDPPPEMVPPPVVAGLVPFETELTDPESCANPMAGGL